MAGDAEERGRLRGDAPSASETAACLGSLPGHSVLETWAEWTTGGSAACQTCLMRRR